MLRIQLILLVTSILSISAQANKNDSIGTKTKDGMIYVVHEVEKGQGLYSISKKYNVSLKALVEENPNSDKGIQIGQLLSIPTKRKAVVSENAIYKKKEGLKPISNEPTDKVVVNTFAKYHTVEKGQTLYSISRKYNCTVDDIKALNNLKDDVLEDGQKIMIPSDGKNVVVDRKVVDVDAEIANIKEKNLNEEDRKTTSTEKKSSSGYRVRVEKITEYNLEKVEEYGKITVGHKELPDTKNFALHHNAPVGTVLMITNPENGSTVFAKVVGNFTKKDESAQILYISKVSAEKIGLKKSTEFVEVSYAR